MAHVHSAPGNCPECNTSFDSLEVARDEDGVGFLVLPVQPCADENCGKFLCPSCDQFHCDGCGNTFCADHMVNFQDLRCCKPCADEGEEFNRPDALPAAMPVRPELRPAAIAWEVA